ncbi:MAG: DUF3307 domain-containing protein [Coriobacteriia bacterium]|nr:DUF3307 domain-containing protein [Coriobacteriia bacterium]
MALFLQGYLGHLLGDFVFQPGRLVLAKRSGLPGMLLHGAIVTTFTVLAMLANISLTWPAAIAAGAAHVGIEHLTVTARRRTGASGLQLFLLDQTLHVVSLGLIALPFAGKAQGSLLGWDMSLTAAASVCGIAAAAFMGSILSFEVYMSAMRVETPAQPVLALAWERVYGMLERGTALALALFASTPSVGVLVFLPRTVWALSRRTQARSQQMIEVAVGLVLCAVIWLAIAALSRMGM